MLYPIASASADVAAGAKREQARAQFQEFVECCYDLKDVNEIWSKDTFISYTKQFLEGVTHISIGKFEEKIKTPTLWSEYRHIHYAQKYFADADKF